MSDLILPEEASLISPGRVVCICYSPIAKSNSMKSVPSIEAVAGQGLKCNDEWDRYALGQGSFNKKSGVGNRQVTFMNARFFKGTPFTYEESFRNVFISGTELLWLLPTNKSPGRYFRIGTAWFQAQKYLDPCESPSKRSSKPGFKETFVDCGAIIASVVESGFFSINDPLFHESKGY